VNARQIEVFHAVMRTGSISGAASLLRVSQPAVSQVLLHTEDQLRFPLFHRVKGRLQASAQAQTLYREVESVYDGLQRVRSLADSLRYQAGGAIQVLASPGPGHSILPESLRLFRARHPQVKVTLDLLSYAPMVEKIKTQQADLAVVMCPSTETTLTASHLCSSRLCCLLPPGHPLNAMETIAPRDLRGHPLIAFSGASAIGRLVMEAFRAAGEEPDFVVAVPFGINTYSLVGAGIGVAVVDAFTAAAADGFGLCVRPFDCADQLDVVILQNRERPSTSDVDAFIALLRQTAGTVGGGSHATN
jgi:DNA-binding transcriptional LysR family regulator